MIQDIAPRKFHNEYQQKEKKDTDIVFLFYKNKILVKRRNKGTDVKEESDKVNQDEISFFYIKELENEYLQYLFSIDDEQYYLKKVWSKEEAEASVKTAKENMEWVTVQSLRESVAKEKCFAAETAYHLFVWYRDNRFCGRCGMEMIADKKERMMRCPDCGNMVYPKIAPAVIVGVIHEDKILMTKYSDREYKKYALIAGFTEIGETAEETVKREVMEEVGLKVKNIVYYKSQPWGFDSNLLMGFYARLDGEDGITLDKNELSVAEWVPREKVKGMDDKISLTREMMENFYQNGEKCLQ